MPKNQPNTDPNNDPAQGDEGREPDYKAMYEQAVAESRKWEARSKANKEKADKWDAASADDETIEERVAKLEKENQDLKTSAARRDLVAKVASETGLSETLVESLNGADEETLLAQAQAVADLKPKGAPSAPEAGKFPRGKQSEDKDDEDRKFVRQLFGRE